MLYLETDYMLFWLDCLIICSGSLLSILIDCWVNKLKSLLTKCMLKFSILIIAESFSSGSNHFHEKSHSFYICFFFWFCRWKKIWTYIMSMYTYFLNLNPLLMISLANSLCSSSCFNKGCRSCGLFASSMYTESSRVGCICSNGCAYRKHDKGRTINNASFWRKNADILI